MGSFICSNLIRDILSEIWRFRWFFKGNLTSCNFKGSELGHVLSDFKNSKSCRTVFKRAFRNVHDHSPSLFTSEIAHILMILNFSYLNLAQFKNLIFTRKNEIYSAAVCTKFLNQTVVIYLDILKGLETNFKMRYDRLKSGDGQVIQFLNWDTNK